MPKTEPRSLTAQIRDLADEVIVGSGYFLVDVDVRGHKGTRVVEVYVDAKTDLGLDDLAVISRELGFLLDVEDVVDGSYKLEVSTPGIKRPITMVQQFVKNVGRTLRVRYQMDESEEEHNIVADLVSADEEGIRLELPSGETRDVPYGAITQARIELPW